MQNNTFYPLALLTIAAIGLYFVFGDYFSVRNVDYARYKEVCTAYLQDTQGKYSDAEKRSLVNKVDYLLPDEAMKINVPIQREVKQCAATLKQRLDQPK